MIALPPLYVARSLALGSLMACLLLQGLALPEAHAWSWPFANKDKAASVESKKQDPLGTVRLEPVSAEERQIRKHLAELLKASNKHDIKAMMAYYSPHFISGDRMDLKTIRQLIVDTWELYPDIQYESEVTQVRLNGDWATVETRDRSRATAVTKKLGEVDEQGVLESESRTLMFWHRVGSQWLIESDATLYEQAMIRFGSAATLPIRFVAPDQVFSGETFTAKVNVPLPEDNYAIASINRELIIYPHKPVKERYRTLSDDKKSLERVFEGNTANRNELVTATVGLISVSRDEEQRPVVALNGVATLVKRVNVLPKAKTDGTDPSDEQVKVSANGKVDMTNLGPESGATDDAGMISPDMEPEATPKPSFDEQAEPLD